MTPTYTHSDCLQNSYKINWRIRDVLGDDNFDKSRRWLPMRLSGAGSVPFLSEHEKRASLMWRWVRMPTSSAMWRSSSLRRF